MANQVISDEQLARMSDAELVEAVRLAGARLATSFGERVTGRLARAAEQMEAELERRLPGSGPDVAEEIVTDSSQLPSTEESTQVEPSATSSGMLLQAGAGAGLGWLAGKALSKKGLAWPVAGAVLGVIFRPVR